jgi:hypothetical protein
MTPSLRRNSSPSPPDGPARALTANQLEAIFALLDRAKAESERGT